MEPPKVSLVPFLKDTSEKQTEGREGGKEAGKEGESSGKKRIKEKKNRKKRRVSRREKEMERKRTKGNKKDERKNWELTVNHNHKKNYAKLVIFLIIHEFEMIQHLEVAFTIISSS